MPATKNDVKDREFWEIHCAESGEEIARQMNGDGGSWRKRLRAAKVRYPELAWRVNRNAKCAEAQIPQKTQVGIAMFDLHYPLDNKRFTENWLDFVRDMCPDIFIFGGDNLDMTPVSHWLLDKHKRGSLEGKRLKADYTGFKLDILRELVLPDDCRKIWLYGNHEDWLNQYIDSNPEMEGLLELEEHIDLGDWERYRYGQHAKVGSLKFIHGAYTNLHHAHKTAQVYGCNVIYGHIHTGQEHTFTTPCDSLPFIGRSVGCGCDLNPSYSRDKPNSWEHQILLFYVRSDGSFNLYPITAINGCFTAPNGKTYNK